MLLLGHLGIGRQLVRPWSKGLSLGWVYVGALLPDLIDKPLYYFLSFDFISGTRTLAHTGVALLTVSGIAWARKSRILAALALGIASHLLLDAWSEEIITPEADQFISILLWPFMGTEFPRAPFSDVWEHLRFWQQPFVYYTEALGALFIGWDLFRYRSRSRVS